MVTMVGALSIPSLCHAQALQPLPVEASKPVQETPTSESTSVSRWYGAPILLADGAAYAALIGGYASEQPELAIGGAATYLLSGPVTHLAHGHRGRAGQSLLLRLGVPLGMAILSATGCDGTHEECSNFALALGGLGMLITTVLDSAVFANDSVKRAKKLAVLPTLSATRDGAVLGAVGTF